MNLAKYDGKCVRIITTWGEVFEGVVSYDDREYAFHEYGRDQEALHLTPILLFKNDILNVISLEDVDGPFGHYSEKYGLLEEKCLEWGTDMIDEVFESEDDVQIGSGMVGVLENEMTEKEFLSLVKEKLNVPSLRHSELLERPIKKVAICGGSGSFLINDAKRCKADVYLTADVKYHDFFDADNEILIVDAGHFETEQFTKQLFADIILKKNPKFAVQISSVKTNSVHYFV